VLPLVTPAAALGPDLPISDSGVRPLPLPPPVGAPPPVVIVGSGRVGAASWLKWAAIGGAVVIVVLLGLVGYLLMRKPSVVVAAAPPPTQPAGHPVIDPPVALADPPSKAAPTAPPPIAPPPMASHGSSRSHSSSTAKTQPKSLSTNQSALASLYGESDKAPVRDLPQERRAERTSSQVNEQQIGEVVRRNKQSLTVCYERVLKRDTSLKNARVDVNVKVGISGSVTAVQIGDPYAGSEIGGCLSQAIRHWHFPPVGEEYSVPFPLLLQAQ
jgi:hypothetical protein